MAFLDWLRSLFSRGKEEAAPPPNPDAEVLASMTALNLADQINKARTQAQQTAGAKKGQPDIASDLKAGRGAAFDADKVVAGVQKGEKAAWEVFVGSFARPVYALVQIWEREEDGREQAFLWVFGALRALINGLEQAPDEGWQDHIYTQLASKELFEDWGTFKKKLEA